jgi:hypothetical protein
MLRVTQEFEGELLDRAERAEANLARAVALLKRWIRYKNRHFSLSAFSVADDTRGFLQRDDTPA